jgi:hypothetical protein
MLMIQSKPKAQVTVLEVTDLEWIAGAVGRQPATKVGIVYAQLVCLE